MRKNVFYSGPEWKPVGKGALGLLEIVFKDREGNEYSWWPKWGDVRYIYLMALVTEWENEGPWKEVKAFVEDAEKVQEMVKSWANMKISDTREAVISLMDKGNFKEAGKILQSDVPEMAEWLAQRQKQMGKT